MSCSTCEGHRFVQAKPRDIQGIEYTQAKPCRACNGTAFWLWANGHYAKDHHHAPCDVCREIRAGDYKRIDRLAAADGYTSAPTYAPDPRSLR